MRTQARTIGMRAIRWAASEREHEERLARQRKEQLAALLQQQQQGELRQHQVRAASLSALGRQIAAALAAPDVKGGVAGKGRLGGGATLDATHYPTVVTYCLVWIPLCSTS